MITWQKLTDKENWLHKKIIYILRASHDQANTGVCHDNVKAEGVEGHLKEPRDKMLDSLAA